MRETIGSLQVLRRPGEDDDSAVVLLHGFGADASDLFPLADILDPGGRWNFYFPNAPNEVQFGGRGWFPISVRDLEAGVDFTKVRPPGLDQSAQQVYDMLFHINAKRLVLGGFSQGAMISTEVALNNPGDVQGLILFSAALLDEAGWSKKAPDLRAVPILQSHGTQDTVLPYMFAQRLNSILKAGGAELSFVSFPGGHEIPVPVVQKAKAFLEKIYGQS